MTAPAKGSVTLGKAVADYLATLARASTKRAYGQALIPMREHFGADALLADLTRKQVSDWLTERWGKMSGGTQNLRHSAVKSASEWWTEQGWIKRELAPAKRPKMRAVLSAEPLSPAEMQALLGQCSLRGSSGIRNKALLMLLYRGGLRLGEALSIRPGDIDHGARSIRVLDTKSGIAQTRYYHESAEDALSRWLDRRQELGVNGRAPVFCTLAGGQLAQRYIRDRLKVMARAAGIDKRVHPHGFRHTFAKELEEEGVHITVISKLLGHSSVAVTAHYLGALTNRQAGLALRQVDMPEVDGPQRGRQASRKTLASLAARLNDLTSAEARELGEFLAQGRAED